jgi:hypothetical protein
MQNLPGGSRIMILGVGSAPHNLLDRDTHQRTYVQRGGGVSLTALGFLFVMQMGEKQRASERRHVREKVYLGILVVLSSGARRWVRSIDYGNGNRVPA